MPGTNFRGWVAGGLCRLRIRERQTIRPQPRQQESQCWVAGAFFPVTLLK